MSELFGSDAFSPREVAARVEAVGVAKARLPLRSMLLLGMLAREPSSAWAPCTP